MHNSNFLSIMQCTHLPNSVYKHLSFRRLLQKDSEVPHQVQMLKKKNSSKPSIHKVSCHQTTPNQDHIQEKAFSPHMTKQLLRADSLLSLLLLPLPHDLGFHLIHQPCYVHYNVDSVYR